MRRAALLLLVACGSRAAAPPPVVEPPVTEPEPIEELDREAAARELEVAVLDSYRMLSAGYDAVYLETLARDDALVLLGVGPEDVLLGFDPRAAAMRDIFGGEGYQLVSKNLVVEVSADGCCAWTTDDLSYRAVRGSRRAFFPLRSSGYYERRDGRWLKLLEHVSYDAAPATALRLAVPMRAELPQSIPEGEDGARARQAIMAAAALGDPRLPNFAVDVGPMRVRVAPGGNVIAAVALVRLRGEGVEREGRGSWVLERAPEGELHPRVTHVSVAVADDALVEAAFGSEPP